MKQIFYALIFTLLFFGNAHAQSLITDANVTIKPGIYRTFSEFKHNSPSLPLPEKHDISKSGPKYIDGNSLTGKRPKEKMEIYGFTDGKNIYINPKLADLSKKETSFSKINFLGRYCTYESKNQHTGIRGDGVGSYTTTEENLYALDMDMGQFMILDEARVTKLIADDAELSAAFKDQGRKNKDLEEFVIKYAQKHPELPTRLKINSLDITPVRSAPIELK